MLMCVVTLLGNLVAYTGTIALRWYFGLAIELLVLFQLNDRNALIIRNSHLSFSPFSLVLKSLITHTFRTFIRRIN